ncbi:MAG: tyrosine-type recombinase/integrase [Candidatus Omnitrophica bacterium]|nr:tyrosine-type recombinase/integrase [Candidatus Omnitrophota bacterium]
MRLRTAVNQYISYRKALGEHFSTDGETLNTFVRIIGEDTNLADVKTESVSKYLRGTTPAITINWHRKYYALHGFYKYALSRGYAQASPLPLTIPKPPPPFVPYIYNTEELRALFNACFSYQKNRGMLDPYVARTFILLLYGTGLRLTEALSLTVADVDLSQALLVIRNTKFHKTRLVPIGKQLTKILLDYATWRKQKRYAVNHDAPFFVGRNGKAINGYNVQDAFELIRKKAGILRTDTNQQPRLHDLRHTFAVHRLTAWYKQGADVQSLLPVLSVYMGHVRISSTSTYLTMTPTLLEEAGRRFEQYAFKKEESHD